MKIRELISDVWHSIRFVLIVAIAAYLMWVMAGQAHAGGRRAPMPAPSPTPSVTASPSPVAELPPPVAGTFVALGDDLGPSVDLAFAARTLSLMNEAYRNGCLPAGIDAHRFISLNSVFTPGVKTSVDARKEYLAGAPYKLDLRWYYKGWPSDTVGYTYNFRNDDWDAGSETRIWSNTRFMGTEKTYAAHLAHELAHQARAGGFVHYTVFGGSFPYDVGDIMEKCVKAL